MKCFILQHTLSCFIPYIITVVQLDHVAKHEITDLMLFLFNVDIRYVLCGPSNHKYMCTFFRMFNLQKKFTSSVGFNTYKFRISDWFTFYIKFVHPFSLFQCHWCLESVQVTHIECGKVASAFEWTQHL